MWNEKANAAFIELKISMSTTPVLAIPNFNKIFIAERDACDNGIGAVLHVQNDRPVAFMSKALGPMKKGWSTYAKEMLGIMEAIHMWKPYLSGRKYHLITDQKSLITTFP